MSRAKLFFILLSLQMAASLSARDDFQSWQDYNLRWYTGETFSMNLNGHFRFADDFSNFTHRRIGQTIATDFAPWLGAALSYRYGEGKSSVGSWNHYQRIEFELTPRWTLGQTRMSLRNRFDLIWREASSRSERSRHRLQASFPIPAIPAARNAFSSIEAFYSFDQNRINEVRTIPLGVNFRLGDSSTFNISYLLRSRRSASNWTQAHIVATSISYSL